MDNMFKVVHLMSFIMSAGECVRWADGRQVSGCVGSRWGWWAGRRVGVWVSSLGWWAGRRVNVWVGLVGRLKDGCVGT